MPTRIEPLSQTLLEPVLHVEQTAHAHPWGQRHFADVLQAGYYAPVLMQGDAVLGYCIAMPGVDEAHLLNLTVAPACQRQGWARLLLHTLDNWALAHGAQHIWLEVRESNARAIALYSAHGYAEMGSRKGYYSTAAGPREDARVMRLDLQALSPIHTTPAYP